MLNSRPSILVLGSTGSVGTQALDVALRLNFPVDGICAHRNVAAVEQQARAFGVRVCAMADESAATELKIKLADTPTKVLGGTSGILDMIHESHAEIAVNSMLGEAGLLPTLAVIESGKQLALANKESLVVAGEIVMTAARQKGIAIRPVDSEHCAIAQSLMAGEKKEVRKLLLTASGGPFFGKTKDELAGVRVKDALAHPTWQMGQKITIDSATMMNKGFEIIEASYLFGVPQDKIDVIVHRESIIHSMVEYNDNSIIAQLGLPDMRTCVRYAVTAPARVPGDVGTIDWRTLGQLTFAAPDTDTFTLLPLAVDCITRGGALPAVLNAANEVAVAAFLGRRLTFTGIADTVAAVVDAMADAASCRSLEEITAADREARRRAELLLGI
jgi:1-deoxy-D-xylulose-5-phosphate reductoisomerase